MRWKIIATIHVIKKNDFRRKVPAMCVQMEGDILFVIWNVCYFVRLNNFEVMFEGLMDELKC